MPVSALSHNKFIRSCFHILFFTTPLLLWPYTTEVFEFNKMVFVYLMTTIITSAWLFSSFKNQKLNLVKTPLDIPILLFFLSQLASTIFSIDPHTSLWGYYSRFHGGLMSTISYILLYYAFVTEFAGDTKGTFSIIKTILATAFITAFYGVLEKFGIDKHVWVQDVQNRVFSTLGQPNWLSAYLIAIVPIPFFFALNTKKTTAKVVYTFLTLLFLTTILFTKSQSGLGATAVILVLSVITYAKKTGKQKFLPLLFIALLIFAYGKKGTVLNTFNSLNKINPFYSDTTTILNKENETRVGGSDSMSIRRVVWEGAIKLGLKYPVFGSGVETFGYAYYPVRPATHNLTSETDFLYNRAHNEYLNFFATTGFFGLAAYLYLVFSIYKVLSSRSSQNVSQYDLNTPLLLGFISILITNFFGFSVVNIALFFFLFPALVIARKSEQKITIEIPSNFFIAATVITIFTLLSLNKVKNIWQADIAYGQGKNNLAGNQKAIALNPSEPLYHSQLGFIQGLIATQVIYSQMATMATAEAELKTKAEGFLAQYIADSLANTQKAVDMNPHHLNLYKNKARAELALGVIDPKYNKQAIQTLLKIIALSPTDPANYYNLGIIYSNEGFEEEAKLAFSKAIELYPMHQGAKDQLNLLKKAPSKGSL